MASQLPVTIIGGYLGAGKTTLLNGLLTAAHGVKLAVIVNDFGSVNIDAALVANRDGETVSLANGCVCCSIGDNLGLTLYDLAERANGPEHIVIEASGVAEPANIARFAASHPRLVLDSIIGVADAETIRARVNDKYVGDLVRRQLSAADIIVPSKTDLVDAAARRQVLAWIATEVPGARIVETPGASLFAQLVLAGRTAPGRPAPHQYAPHQHADGGHAELFSTWSFCSDRPLDGAALRAAVAALPPAVIRAKGILCLAEVPDRQFVLQVVGRRWSLEPAPAVDPPQQRPGHSDMVFIGLSGEIDPQRLAALFAGAEVKGPNP
jgi:G3E family GTPase